MEKVEDPLYQTDEWKAMIDDKSLRYSSMPSHDPCYRHMVWDFEENTTIAYSDTAEQAFRIAKALNEHARGTDNSTGSGPATSSTHS